MWTAIIPRFYKFHRNLLLTQAQVDDGHTKQRDIRQCLNRNYYGVASDMANSFLIGSWGKGTCARPPRDVDLYFVLPVSVYYRYQTNLGNRQSSLLQEVKNVLLKTYPTTTMRGDGQVVIVGFSTFDVEVVPAFLLDNGRYWICNTHNGGCYTEADPQAEIAFVESVDKNNANNLRPITMMLKAWQATCNIPIKSFQLELVAAAFLQQSPWRLNGYYWYDWIFRDFFAYLWSKANTFVFVPGTNEPIYLGDEWRSRVETAYNRAYKACQYEYFDQVSLAGDEWQKIFGQQIPRLIQQETLLAS